MIDFTLFFFVFELLREISRWQIGAHFNVWHVVFFAAIVACLWIAFGLTKKKADTVKFNFHDFSRLLAIINTVVWVVFCLLIYQRTIASWGNVIAQLLDTNTGKILLGSALFLGGLLFFILHFFQSRKPTKDSKLNRRQVSMVLSFIFWSALVLFVANTIAFSVYKRTILMILLGVEWLSIFMIFYDPVLFILSCIFTIPIKRAQEPTPGKMNRYAVLICAHNEEAVVGSLIESLLAMSYSKEYYDIFTICDNCTDSTAQVVQQAGAIAMERTDIEKRGKAFGLEWMFDILEEKRQKGDAYDAYVILDADNLVNIQFLDEINLKMNQGYEILQAYLGCKNPNDTWVTKCYSISYWLSNINYQNAHSKLGLSAQMGGTGMIIRPSVLKEVGWRTDSLTEDLLLTTSYVQTKNRSCCWVHKARLYDEKPLKIRASTVQRTRWMQGHMDVLFKNGLPLLGKGILNLSFRQIDTAVYLARPFLNLVLFVVYMLRVVTKIVFPDSFMAVDFLMSFRTAMGIAIFCLLVQTYSLIKEGYFRYVFWIPFQLIYTYTWYKPIFRGILKHKELYWVSTEHKRNMSMDEVLDEGTFMEESESV